jgi:pimeloyl-ACP methyl ester carboxylesterase
MRREKNGRRVYPVENIVCRRNRFAIVAFFLFFNYTGVMKIFIFTLGVFVLPSCATTYNLKNPYPHMEILSFSYYKGYEFKNYASKKLLIVLEGSGWTSVLGEKRKQTWREVGIASQMLQVLQDRYTIFIPEKFNREPGVNYFEDRNERAEYTFDNLLACYREIINEYLSKNEYESIVIMGGSEGAIVLPVLYYQLDNINVSLLVSISGGGLSPHEAYPILAASEATPKSWKKLYNQVIEKYKSKPYPDSLEIGFLGMPFRFWSSIVDIRPIDYYQNIDIPILFIQGEKDYRIPKESTQFIGENLPEKPFDYIYYPEMEHGPSGYKDAVKFREDIAKWIIEHDP